MKLKNKDIVNFLNGTHEMMNKKLPVKLGYAVNRNIKIMESCAMAYNEEQEKILNTFARRDESGEFAVLEGRRYDIEDIEGYRKALDSLLEIENEINLHAVPYVCVEQCGEGSYDALSPRELGALEVMMEE